MERVSPTQASARLALILSPERSGSTLLSVMLGAHRRIVAPPELHLLRYPDLAAWRQGYPAAGRSLDSLLAMLELDAKGVTGELEGLPMERVYAILLDRCGEGRILVDKSPAYAHAMASLERGERLKPFYIWLVRHPLGVAASRIERLRGKRRREGGVVARLKYPLFVARETIARLTGRELQRELAHWRDVHVRIAAFLGRIEPDRQAMVWYEDLVSAPDRELSRLCAGLGLALEPAMLDPHSHAPRELGWGVGDEKVLRHRTVDSLAATRWRRRYAEAQLDAETRALWLELGRRRSPA
jgi:hypothetical protein